MNRNYILFILLLTLACIGLIAYSMWHKEAPLPPQEELFSTPVPPFASYISAVGIVEAGSDNIFIGSPLNRIVEKVFVDVGSQVKKGEPLFRLEDRDLKADLNIREVEYKIAMAKMKKLQEFPRQEDVITAEAELKSADVAMQLAKNQYEIAQSVRDTRALSKDEINRRRVSYEQAEARWQQTKADLDKLKAGTWKPDLDIAELEVLQAKAALEKVKTDIKRAVVRSPIDGLVLQIKIHEGEFPPLDTSKTPLMVIGNTTNKHLQVSINQFNAPYFKPEAPAVAFLQGDGRIVFPLEFVRLEPYLVNKQNLSNEITEKVDTRVLQVTYRFKNSDHGVFVGQQMDVFIETDYQP